MTARDVERARAERYAAEDREAERAADVVEPLLPQLKPGRHYFGPKQFAALTRYLLIDVGPISRALHEGRFTLRGMCIVRVDKMTAARMATASELARATGVSQPTLWRLLNNNRLPYWQRGRQKLYDIEQVKALLFTRHEDTDRFPVTLEAHTPTSSKAPKPA
jgi:excisionase family DNA binding protein